MGWVDRTSVLGNGSKLDSLEAQVKDLVKDVAAGLRSDPSHARKRLQPSFRRTRFQAFPRPDPASGPLSAGPGGPQRSRRPLPLSDDRSLLSAFPNIAGGHSVPFLYRAMIHRRSSP
jgi:hypothetical protein